jgi:hypothetical protein
MQHLQTQYRLDKLSPKISQLKKYLFHTYSAELILPATDLTEVSYLIGTWQRGGFSGVFAEICSA